MECFFHLEMGVHSFPIFFARKGVFFRFHKSKGWCSSPFYGKIKMVYCIRNFYLAQLLKRFLLIEGTEKRENNQTR